MAISGRYEAHGHDPHGRELLHLRVDVDRVSADAPVTNWISGDVFERNQLDRRRGKHVFSWRIEVPPIDATAGERARSLPFALTGTATQLMADSVGVPLPIAVAIARGETAPELTCTVRLTLPDGVHTYTGTRQGPEFRRLELGIAFCTDGFQEPDCVLLPPDGASVAARTLTLQQAWAAAGVELIRNDAIRIEDTSGHDRRDGWSTSELHASLEAQLRKRGLHESFNWPRWFLWGLLAEKHSGGALGVMFDEEEPNRQGFAVFQSHRHARLPTPGLPLTAAHTAALRLYFFTWMHEIGHGFNLDHSSRKSRVGALSWMNDEGALKDPAFWERFQFSFDADEIAHIRHGNWEEVVMGGLPLGRGGHLRDSSRVVDAMPAVLDESAPPPPLRIVLSRGGYFDFMRPVTIQVELQNWSEEPIPTRRDLDPESGSLVVLIRRPDGRTVEYAPPVRTLAEAPDTMLQPGDSHRELLDLTYGRDGFSFDHPGQYVLRAMYVGDGTNFIVSDPLRVRIGFPLTPALDHLAQDFFTRDIGRCLYFHGSRSPYLDGALSWLSGVARDELLRGEKEGRTSWLGADLARVIADQFAKPFRHIDESDTIRTSAGDPALAAELTSAALRVYQSDVQASSDPRYQQLARTHRAVCEHGCHLCQPGPSES